MELSSEDQKLLFDLIKKKSGIALSAEKAYLLEPRLLPVARQSGLQTLQELVDKIRATNSEEMIGAVVEAMTTNESSFFRDHTPFDNLSKIILPSIKGSCPSKEKLRVWSAAASTGQEAYSIMMQMLEENNNKFDIEIMATDISAEVLEKAKKGLYTQFEVQRGLPVPLLLKYFLQVEKEWQISDQVKEKVQFMIVNLIQDFSRLGKFDIIFCRNVLIYFDSETKVSILTRIANCMEPHSFLFLGSAETVMGVETKFTSVEGVTGLFKLNSGG